MRIFNRIGLWVVFGVIILSLALTEVFSFVRERGALRDHLYTEKNLLLTEANGLMDHEQAFSFYGKLDPFVAISWKVDKAQALRTIARRLQVPTSALRSTNDLDNTWLHRNQNILLQNKPGMAHVAGADEPIDAVIRKFRALGAKESEVLAANDLDEITFLKGGKLYLKAGSKLWFPDARRSFPYFAVPVRWSKISSGFGYRRDPLGHQKKFHAGYDMAAPYGAPVYASSAGTVKIAGWHGGYGNLVELAHAKLTTRYGHLSKIVVRPGEKVKKRQLIGYVGDTGRTTGPHLHFEVRRNSDGKALRPGQYIF